MRNPCQVVPIGVTPIDRLANQFRQFLHLPDPSMLYTLMGAVAANMIEGPPVWLMLVGPPSCGKSELLNSLLSMPHTVEAADIASEAAFLSGSSDRDRAKDATGGILRQTGAHGGLILNDFTSILSKQPDKIALIMAVFREVYGGRWTRHIGGDGGRMLSWVGKLAAYAGCTSQIDQHHQVCSQLGERWVNFRFDPRMDDEYFAEAMMTLAKSRPDNWREVLNQQVKAFFSELGLGYRSSVPRREFSNKECICIHALAHMAVSCRSGVPRDSYSHEIIGARETELPTRLATVLGQLLAGMDLVGVPPRIRWKLLLKVCMDSMPRMRRIVIEAVAQAPASVEELTVPIGCCLSVAKRVVEDLEVHRVVHRTSGRVSLTDWMAEKYTKLQNLQNPSMTVTLLCPTCQRYFTLPAANDEDGLYDPPIPEHEPCCYASEHQKNHLESK